MTFQEIKDYLAACGKPVSDAQTYRYLYACEIKSCYPPISPRRYPDNAGRLIADWLGLPPLPANVVQLSTPARAGGVASLAKLRAVKKGARR